MTGSLALQSPNASGDANASDVANEPRDANGAVTLDVAAQPATTSTKSTTDTAASSTEPARAGSASGRRLTQSVFAYLLVMTLLVTWAPFDFALSVTHGFSWVWTWRDIVLNVVMFLPLGLFARASFNTRSKTAWWVIGAWGAMLSAGIELGQLFIADRFSSAIDVVTNGLGAAIGAYVFDRVRLRLQLRAATISAFALELPLTGLVVLLVPLLWASGLGSLGNDGNVSRVWLMLPVAAFGGALLGAVHGAYLHHSGRVSRATLLIAAALWFLLASLPGASNHWDVLLAGSVLAVGAAALRSYSASRARLRDGAQRVELPTLRLVLPLFAIYLVLSSLWPLDSVDGTWRGAWSLAPARAELSVTLLMRAIEHLAAMTIVGYVTAELHGRSNRPYREIWPRVLRMSSALVCVIEVARGWNTAQGASASLALLAVASAAFGGWLYHAQRDHVRTLLARTT